MSTLCFHISVLEWQVNGAMIFFLLTPAAMKNNIHYQTLFRRDNQTNMVYPFTTMVAIRGTLHSNTLCPPWCSVGPASVSDSQHPTLYQELKRTDGSLSLGLKGETATQLLTCPCHVFGLLTIAKKISRMNDIHKSLIILCVSKQPYLCQC